MWCSCVEIITCMRKQIKLTIFAALLAVSIPSAWGFALLGPLPPNAGGETWQVGNIGYDLAYLDSSSVFSPGGRVWLGDIGGPHNWAEEYRRVTPTMYYAYDANFLEFFGLAGTTNCDAAFAIMNSLTNVSFYSQTLTAEFPNNSQAFNPMAQALYLLDLKSVTLHLIVEQLGLAEPERYTWTIHDRFLPPGCPLTTTYLIVQRNFNDYDQPLALNQVGYSPIVNGILYTYNVLESCRNGTPYPDAVTVPFAADPLVTSQYTAVAANDDEPFGGLQLGGFYTGLTRDDIAGLRYLYNSNNINFEATAPSGALLLQTNTQAPTTLTTLPLSLLFQSPMTNDPATLQANFPGISFLAVQTNFVNFRFTNSVAYYTNLVPPFTNFVAGFPTNINFQNWNPLQYASPVIANTLSLADFIAAAKTNDPATLQGLYPDLVIKTVVTNDFTVNILTNTAPYYTNQTVSPILSNNIPGGVATGFYFTNQPGPTVLNFPLTQQIFTNIDLYSFTQQARTNDPATLQALYPSLWILSSYSVPTNLDIPNVVTYFTNALPGSPVTAPPRLIIVTNGFTRIFYNQYFYTFGNVVTNHVYNTAPVTVTTSFITNRIGSPFQNNFTNIITSTFYTNQLSGDLLIIPTNWCGFDVVTAYSPYPTMGVSNTVGTASFTNVLATNTYFYSQTIYYVFTNRTYNVSPGICNPKLVFGTNYSTNIAVGYNYTFGNVLTNHYYTNTLVKIYTTNVFVSPGMGTNTTTNSTLVSFYTNKPSGDIFIVPPTWCGYSYVSLLTNLNTSTNFFSAGGITNAVQYYDQTTVTYFTNYTLSLRPAFCEAVVAFGTNYSTNLITTYSYTYSGVVTNRYNPNSLATVVTTNLAAITNGLVGALTNLVGTNIVGVGVGGDFFVIPPQWCGLKILATNLNTIVIVTNTVTTTNSPTPDIGQRFTQTIYTTYTNTTYTVQPLICSTVSPAPNLRRGIERIQFVRANYDSLIGQFFQPITNTYSMIVITNSQQVTEYYQRVVTQPDFRLSAQDLAVGPAGNNFNGTVIRNINYDSSQVLQNLRGPGTLIGSSTFTYNKVGAIYGNGPFADTNSFFLYTTVNETTQYPGLQWASYDSSTNSIILYPNYVSVQNLANSIFIQMLPVTVPNGTVGVPYPTQLFTASGGQPPYTWSAPNISGVFPGMNFNPATQQLFGTPTAAGTFTFVIRLTDSVNRTVDYTYTVTIQ